MTAKNCTKAPQEKVCGYEYTVRRGDSFYLIANRLGVPLRDLLEANSDINPARLMVGDVLCIPMEEDDAPPATPPAEPTPTEPPTSTTPAAPTPEEDDLDAPATLPEGSVDSNMAVCPEADRYIVSEGETAADIQLRADVNLHTLRTANPNVDLSALQAGQSVCVPAQNLACPVPATYTLQTDETLESTALKLNASLSSLLRANPCLAPSDFKAGVCIWIPEE